MGGHGDLRPVLALSGRRVEPFGMHTQSGWESLSANHRLPDWLRVTALCYGHHRANGHAVFGPGDVRTELVRVDESTGEVTFPDSSTVTRAVRTAVEYNFLGRGSTVRCLVAPQHVSGGLGHEMDRCPVHDGRARAPERPLAVA